MSETNIACVEEGEIVSAPLRKDGEVSLEHISNPVIAYFAYADYENDYTSNGHANHGLMQFRLTTKQPMAKCHTYHPKEFHTIDVLRI
ncbi:hypothetical protein M514_22626 [Trichuris suis]|uniref:Uncharacterized protein n=1 Tax=Trichuris suis TaxID=68888 RepID=A0A085N6Q5_9BILA|nr:hypothetical protein M514_22626 [Trichuris suis]